MKKYAVSPKAKRIDIFDERFYRIEIPNEDPKQAPEIIDLPSVTTYLEAYPKGMGFNLWLKNTKDPDAVRDEAGQVGSYVHDLIKATLNGATVKFKEGKIIEWERFLSWCQWWKELNAEHVVTLSKLHIEFIVYDLEYETAGTVDCMPTVDDIFIPYDWKSGNFIGDTAEIQVSIYRDMIMRNKEQVHIDDDAELGPAWLIQLNPKLNKKGLRPKEVKDHNMQMDTFFHTKALWKRQNKNPKPKYRTYPTQVNLKYIGEEDIIKGA